MRRRYLFPLAAIVAFVASYFAVSFLLNRTPSAVARPVESKDDLLEFAKLAEKAGKELDKVPLEKKRELRSSCLNIIGITVKQMYVDGQQSVGINLKPLLACSGMKLINEDDIKAASDFYFRKGCVTVLLAGKKLGYDGFALECRRLGLTNSTPKDQLPVLGEFPPPDYEPSFEPLLPSQKPATMPDSAGVP